MEFFFFQAAATAFLAIPFRLFLLLLYLFVNNSISMYGLVFFSHSNLSSSVANIYRFSNEYSKFVSTVATDAIVLLKHLLDNNNDTNGFFFSLIYLIHSYNLYID